MAWNEQAESPGPPVTGPVPWSRQHLASRGILVVPSASRTGTGGSSLTTLRRRLRPPFVLSCMIVEQMGRDRGRCRGARSGLDAVGPVFDARRGRGSAQPTAPLSIVHASHLPRVPADCHLTRNQQVNEARQIAATRA